MLRRCYYAPENKPWRDGCTVAEEWHNFQAFADWYDSHYPSDGNTYQLDKDMRVKDNKCYGPDTCKFVTQQENLAARRFKCKRPPPQPPISV